MTKDPSVDGDGSIGIFDSGVGGLSVLKQIHTIMPYENLVYFADQQHVPYGPRSDSEVQRFSLEISRFLIGLGAKIIVVACNTASAAALEYLRETLPDIAFVGMEPAIKPGAVETQNGRVGVLATVGTFDSRRYASLMTRFAREITIYEDSCPGLVEQIEAGELDSRETRIILSRALSPMLREDVDTLILGCTHYPFVLPLIEEIAGPKVTVIDPAPAVARQSQRVLLEQNLLNSSSRRGKTMAYSTAKHKVEPTAKHKTEPKAKYKNLARMCRERIGYFTQVRQATWSSGKLSS